MTLLALPPAPVAMQRLAQAFVVRQGVPVKYADLWAQRLVEQADDDILRAAEHWASTGEMHQTPMVCGHTPASLSDSLLPSQVFSGSRDWLR